MADKTFTISSFKYGLDTRRESLAAQPGTLVQCRNGHINPGGEAEKRKAFVPAAVLLPSNTLGLQDTAAGIMVFGGANAPNGPLPAGVVYQQLLGPFGGMTGVIFSCNYQGKAFVVASDPTGVYCFYNGVLVNDSWNGRVISLQATSNTQAQLLAAAVNAIPGWNAVLNLDGFGHQIDAGVFVKSPNGITFQPTFLINSAAGLIGAVNENDTLAQLAGTPNVASVAAFLMNGGAGAISITAPLTSLGTGVANLCTAVTVTGVAATDGTNIAAAINANTPLYGYSSYTDGAGNVFVSAPVAWGALANGFVLTIVVSGAATFTVASVPSPLTVGISTQGAAAFVNGNNVFDTYDQPNDGANFSVVVQANPGGGYTPYTYVWSVQYTGSNNGITFNPDASGKTCAFSKFLLGPVTIEYGLFNLAVTDSNPGGHVTVNFPFTLTFRNL